MSLASAPPADEEGATTGVFRSPDLPFVSAIVGGMMPGRAIVVSGLVLQPFANDAKRFFIDLCCGLLIQGDHMDNKALHFNARFDANGGWLSGKADRQLVLNTYLNNTWGDEERFDNPFEEGKPFTIRILALDKYFKIAVNGRHVCDYRHRVPVESIQTIYVGGNIRVDYIEFQPALGAGGPITPVTRTDEVKQIDKPAIPFFYDLPFSGFIAPQTMRFTLTPFVSGKRFSINFYDAQRECLFHFRVDLPNGIFKPALVRNSTKDKSWQKEERDMGEFPFAKGLTNDVVVTAFGKSVAVDVDGLPTVKFNYRPGQRAEDIVAISVEGDLILQRFVHKF